MIQIIEAPFDGGGAQLGSRLGPEAIKLANLDEELSKLGLPSKDWIKIPQFGLDPKVDGLRNFSAFHQTIKQLYEDVGGALNQGDLPLVLGGEHSISVGSIAAAALAAPDETCAVLWIDAHADLNTPATSESGNLHGMPLAILAGLDSGVHGIADLQWKSIKPASSIKLDQICWLGLRDVDQEERRVLRSQTNSQSITMFDIDRDGLASQVDLIDGWLKGMGAKRLWISFDVDVMDPILAPGTGTAVRGGLSYREAHMLAELLHQLLSQPTCPYRLVGLDVVEVNPLQDQGNQTAKMAVEWICSLFGKSILGGPGS